MESYDFLVIGSGIAGLSFALKAAEGGRVAVLCKSEAAACNTNLAQGGLAAALASSDSRQAHMADTLAAGSGLNNPEAVALLATEAPGCISELLALGVPFDTLPGGKLSLGLEGGHSHHRIVHARDQTGKYIHQQLLQAVQQHAHIRLLEHHLALDLMIDSRSGQKRCMGARVLDVEHNLLCTFYARATVLASGGAGQLYQYSTNPAMATGDGVAMAYRAGAQLADMEFVQFHPTTLYKPGQPVFLISEAVRGAGAELVLPTGEPFMHRYHPLGSLAPRDIVAQAMQQEMQQSGADSLFLDMRRLSQEHFSQHFPAIYQTLLQQGIDPQEQLVPVVPAAHYMCGGISTNAHGQTTLPGLYACGECACTGLHGANRLASNSLPEGWIMGRRAAQHALAQPVPAAPLRPVESCFVPLAHESALAGLLRQQLQEGMWQYAGIVRTRSGLLACQRLLEQLAHEVEEAQALGRLSPPWLELRNLVQVAQLVTRAALARTESCGCHYLQPDGKPAAAAAEAGLALELEIG
ncbi:L-aspartate oxidase [Cesiribacter andamanensis]|uniref:L-aspartate oxidase n=1 Tax=Cesiribacter andamanensis AMV16 TaxID=1279009 RepID=M7N2Q2_9BACT|nr:L-aspartate oxidase [Cesiribacter andamanensis]EMR02953.1 L-aspartate oxidase [Cesiribacter andamanensis AMV16]